MWVVERIPHTITIESGSNFGRPKKRGPGRKRTLNAVLAKSVLDTVYV